jgi:hypothetical protein
MFYTDKSLQRISVKKCAQKNWAVVVITAGERSHICSKLIALKEYAAKEIILAAELTPSIALLFANSL